MKTKLSFSILLFFACYNLSSQVPHGFNYQAIARDGAGNPIINTALPVTISIQSDSLGGTLFWEELHSQVITNNFGLFVLVIGKGVRQPGSALASFYDINWSETPKFIKTQVLYNSHLLTMGVARLYSVPYAMVAGDLARPVKKLAVKGETVVNDEALFEVKNRNGQTIMAVYNEGVRIWVDDGAKGEMGGFAVGGFDMTKGTKREYFVVSDDSIRIYVDSNPETKTVNGGFAVAGYDLAKGVVKDYLTIGPDSTNIYVRKIDEETVSTFNIIGVGQEGDRQYLLIADPDTITLAGVLQIQYNIIVTTAEVNLITRTSAVSGGNVVSDGDAIITARGICWSTDPNPTTNDAKTDEGVSVGTFSSEMTGLSPGTTYHVRAYATNLQGTAYGADVAFTTVTAPVPPTVTTTAVFPVEATSAISGGNILSDGGAEITARGVCWSTSVNPTINDEKTGNGTGSGSFASSITGLAPETTYHVRAYATNVTGTAYGADVSFSTPVCIRVYTLAVSSVSITSALSGGSSISNCGAEIIARGVCWGTSPGPTISGNFTTDGTGTGSFASNITGLTKSTLYFLRAYVTTSLGTYYGNEISFVTLSTITDIDGNVYKVVPIGTQYWMQENLKTETLNDGTPITHVTIWNLWYYLLNPGLCFYDNDEATNKNTFGPLYNWYSVRSGKLCPNGWHVPTHDDFTTLITYLGGEQTAGYKMKEAGITHWSDPNQASNESGFTALPGGSMYSSDSGWYFNNKNTFGFWWTATENTELSLIYSIQLYSGGVNTHISNHSKTDGLSVRCIKD